MRNFIIIGVVVTVGIAGLIATRATPDDSKPPAREGEKIPVSPSVVLPMPDRPGDVADWFALLVRRRRSHLKELDRYAGRKRYPKNTDFENKRVPYFVDEENTACAVAALMRFDGQAPVVDWISKYHNHVRVMDVDQGPLVDWILYSGLTREECALIQPRYSHSREELDRSRISVHFARTSRKLRLQERAALITVMDRLMPRIRRHLGVERMGFTVQDGHKNTLEIRNGSARPIRIRKSLVSHLGTLLERGRWTPLEPEGVARFKVASWKMYVLFVWQSDEQVDPCSIELHPGRS